MEEEKKRRKNNKKKKNKQQPQQIDKAATEDDAPDRVVDRNRVANGKHEGRDVERDKVSDDCVVASSTAEDEKRLILQEKGNLENSLNQLRCENDLISEEKASLESKVMELQSDKKSWLLKEASLEEKISKLSNERAFLSLEQGNLKETIEQIKGEKESWISKEVSELEELKNHSVKENFALKDHLSKLQTQIPELEKNDSIAHTLDQDIKGVATRSKEGVGKRIDPSPRQASRTAGNKNELNYTLERKDGMGNLVGNDGFVGFRNATLIRQKCAA